MYCPNWSISTTTLFVLASTIATSSDRGHKSNKVAWSVATCPATLLIWTSIRSRSILSPVTGSIWYFQTKRRVSPACPAAKFSTFRGGASFPIISCVLAIVEPLIFLFKGVTLAVTALGLVFNPFSILSILNLILPSESTPAAETFTVLNDVKSPVAVPDILYEIS